MVFPLPSDAAADGVGVPHALLLGYANLGCDRERDSGLTQASGPNKVKWKGSEWARPGYLVGREPLEGASQALGHRRKSIRRGPDLAPPPSVPVMCMGPALPWTLWAAVKRPLVVPGSSQVGREGSWPKMPRPLACPFNQYTNAFLQDWWSILHFYKLHNTKTLKTYTYFNKNGTNFNINVWRARAQNRWVGFTPQNKWTNFG